MIYPPSQGSYYHLAKRLLGIEYVKRVEEDEDERDAEKNTGPVFRLLGGVAAVHLALSILQTLRRPPALQSIEDWLDYCYPLITYQY